MYEDYSAVPESPEMVMTRIRKAIDMARAQYGEHSPHVNDLKQLLETWKRREKRMLGQ